MSKLTHPARPVIDWKQVEKLSLSLFKINGVELQTGAWYTLARSHLARVSGLSEGLAILTALLSHQWAQLWPRLAHARAEIINGLLQRVQKLFRTFSLGAAEVPALVLAEKRLLEMKDILRRQELEHACQLNPALQLIRSALSRLVYVIQKAPEVSIQVTEEQPVSPKGWPVFVAGMATALVLSTAAILAGRLPIARIKPLCQWRHLSPGCLKR